jgi:hypothetical protein
MQGQPWQSLKEHQQRRFPPGSPLSSYIHYKLPNIVNRANNVLVDAQLSTHLKKTKKTPTPYYSGFQRIVAFPAMREQIL